MSAKSGVRAAQIFGWNNPDRLVTEFIADIRDASYGIVNYQIAERILVDDFLPMEDGFTYTPEEYLRCWQARRGFHLPDRVDYHHLLSVFDLENKVNHQGIDEVWTIGLPYAGFFESRMTGPGAFWCNAPPLNSSGKAKRRFIIMAFNFERTVGEMLESYGHRVESIMEFVYRKFDDSNEGNLWKRFTRHDKITPGKAEVGTIHFAPNSESDYDWGNRRNVLSHSQAWYKFPDLSTPPRMENCSEWGNGDIRDHHVWWFRHLPHVQGQINGISNNWWEYIVDPNLVNS